MEALSSRIVLVLCARFGLFVGLPAVLLWAALSMESAGRAFAQTGSGDDWSLTRKPEARKPGPGRASAREPLPRLLAAAAQDPEQTYLAERLLRAYEQRDGHSDTLLRTVEAEAASGPAEPEGCAVCAARNSPACTQCARRQRWWLLLAQLRWLRAEPVPARASFERAIELGPDARSLRRFAAFAREQRAWPEARALLQRALPLPQPRASRTELITQLAELCLELGDLACAQTQFDALARQEPGSLDQALAYPRALAGRQAHAAAAAAYEARLTSWRGDARGRAVIQLELGKTRLAEGALREARELFEQARRQLGTDPELLELLLQTHRGLGALAELAEDLSRGVSARSASAQLVAGRALEELAQPAAALAAYRRALERGPRDPVAAERVLSLLQREGRHTEVIATYQRLLRRPNPEPQLLASLGELLRRLGRAPEALELAAHTGRAHPRDVKLHELLVELYTRWQEPERARAELEWLARIEPGEPRHVFALAEQELAQGHQERAVAVLRRMSRAGSHDTRAHLRLGRAYADHELSREALGEYEAALRMSPGDLEARRGRALALARLYRYRDAEAEWQGILASAGASAEDQRDAREQLVQIWAELGELERRVRDYEAAFGYATQAAALDPGRRARWPEPAREGGSTAAPDAAPDPEAGRMLAEAYQRLARQPTARAQPASYLRGAEDVLGRVVRLDASDSASWRALEKLRTRRGDREGSIQALEALVRLEPQRAAPHLMHMAEHAHAAYQDEAALGYAERALAAAPADASVHEWLGDLYRTRRESERAIEHYTRALESEPQRFELALRLAELHAQRGDPAAAQRLLLRVLQGSRDPAVVVRAGRTALQIAGTEAARVELERELIARVSSDPQRSDLRRVLIELYEASLPALLDRAAGADPAAARALDAFRARAQKPLLDALLDPDEAQLSSAVRLLRWLGTSAAAVPLMALAEGGAELSIRRDALAVSCALGGETLLARQLALALASPEGLREMAAFCVARDPSRAAGPALRKLAGSEAPSLRAFALIGLGKLGPEGEPTTGSTLRSVLASDVSAWVRASAALALGLFGEPSGREPLLVVLRGSDSAIAQTAALALGMLGDRAATAELVGALFEPRPGLAEAAQLALHALGCNRHIAFELSAPEQRPAIDSLLADARRSLATCSGASLEYALGAIEAASRRTLRGPDSRRARALDWLLEVAAVAPSGDPGDAWRSELLSALLTELPALARSRAWGVRLQVARLLAHVPASTAEPWLVALVGDSNLDVRGAALEVLAGRELPDHAEYVERLAEVADGDEAFAMRRRAVLVLDDMRGSGATRALLHVLASDPFALVRESAAEALSDREADLAGPALLAAVRSDVEPRVRLAAARSLRRVGGAPLETARTDRQLDPGVRQILQAD